jgi:hypothetical protein
VQSSNFCETACTQACKLLFCSAHVSFPVALCIASCRLDFKGGSVSGRAWKSGANVTWPAFDSNGNSSSFSTTELTQIVTVWRAVSEDFSPFLVDVTTVDQIAAKTPNNNYMRVAIGGTSQSVISPNLTAGGIAYVGVYGRVDLKYQPAFVFSGNLGPSSRSGSKNIWEAVSHEVSGCYCSTQLASTACVRLPACCRGR